MFKSIELENFKAFGERTVIEFAPITLIFGQNSAGKSSILQALSLLKQTRESRDQGSPLLPRVEGGITDLGSFQEMLFDHDRKRTLTIGLQIDTERTQFYPRALRQWLGGLTPKSIGISIRFHRPGPEDEVSVSGFDVNWPKLNEPFASFSSRDLDEPERNFVDSFYWHRSRGRRGSQNRKLRGAVCSHLSNSSLVWKTIYPGWSQNRTSVTKALESLNQDIRTSGPPFLPAADNKDSNDAKEENAHWRASLRDALEFYHEDFNFDQFVSRMTAGAQSVVMAMDGFIPIPIPLHLRRVAAPELYALGRARARDEDEIPAIDISDIAPFVGHMLEVSLESLFPMGPYRRPPERWYIFTGTSPEDVGYRGDLLPDLLFRRSDLIEEANMWLERLDIGYALRVRAIGQASDLFEVRLVDRRRKDEVDVALSDVGFGISQILPFIVQTLASTGQVISIEQPEVHLHPKLQADLGNLLTTAIEKPYKHQFLVETHSEHLILRLQKLVRERKLRPEDISVIFVSRGGTGSSARRLRLDDDGRFMDEWPGGFFAERLRELL